MDLTLSETQTQILDAVDRILARNGGWRRARDITDQAAHDDRLFDELQEGGFTELALADGTGPLDAALVVERVAEDAAVVANAASLLVYPMVVGRPPPGPVAIADAGGGPFRLGQAAKVLLIQDGDRALRLEPDLADITPVNNDRTGWPLTTLSPSALGRAEDLGTDAGARLRDWRRVGLALEMAGAMRGALATTTQYVKDRVQFGRPIGTFQAIHHRLAQLTVQAEGAYWLALDAAYKNADPLQAAAAATHAALNAPAVLRETQQMHGAIGFTREYPLHLWTLKLPALQRELGGAMAHARAVAKGLAA
jgi:alkylation response protein AidB-like acyl-CoA dehydrogenase